MVLGSDAVFLAPVVGLMAQNNSQDGEPVIPSVAPRAADTLVMLPDGSTVHVELAKTEAEREYGLMGRTSLPQGHGMLFIHDRPGQYGYWMYHCKIGLDIIWMDEDHRIVELSPNTPPCRGQSRHLPVLWRSCHILSMCSSCLWLDQSA